MLLVIVCAAVLFGSVAPAVGQTTTQSRAFNIPPQPLASALRQLAAESGLQIAFTTDDVGNLQSKGVQGSMSARQALSRLLAGTGVSFRFTGQNTVALRRGNNDVVNVPGSVTLPTIDVAGASETAWGPVEGYVATRSAAGSKSDTPIVEIPQSVSVVTNDQMRDRNVQTVVEALQYTPGVVTHAGGKDPRFDGFYIRGFNTQGYGSYRDGLRELGDANNFGYFRTEPYGLERIDVIRGPASVLYGQNAPGGLIDKISKRPSTESTREVVGEFGDYKRYQGAFDVGGAGGDNKQYQFRLTGLARESNAQIAYFSDFVKDDRQVISPAFTWQPTGDTKFTLLTEFLHDLTGNAFPVSQVKTTGTTITGVNATKLFLGDPNFNKFEQSQYRVGYEFEHRFNDMFMVRQNTRYGAVDVDYRYLTGNQVNAIPTVARVSRTIDETTDSFNTDTQLHAKVATGPFEHKIVGGVDYLRFNLDDVIRGGTAPSLNVTNPVYYVSVATPTAIMTSTDQTTTQLGTYIQDQIKFQNWLLTLGARYDWATINSNNRVKTVVTQTDDQAFTKRLGLTYLFENGLAPYVSYSTSFLPTTGTDFSGNPFLPTKGRQYEGGVKYQPPGTKTLLTAAVYDIVQQNVLTADTALGHTGFNVQTGEVRSRGFEAQATTTLTERLSLIASYSQQKVEVTQSNGADLGKVPVLVPQRTASLWGDYTFPAGPVGALGFGAGVRYIGQTYADLANTIPNDAYTVYDAAFHYEVNGFRLAVNVSNLFGKEQALCTTSGGCQWISPRTVTLTARYKW
ncbi:TonB-dependent siderophore receptor [Microbacteriaceae bacterium K1510]|nr:TonB-dependent siderophore receptor [Microbacteriaceae bacterium K1510]